MASIAMEMETVANGAARSAPDEPPYLEFRDLSKIYATDDGPIRALDGISISQRKREGFFRHPTARCRCRVSASARRART